MPWSAEVRGAFEERLVELHRRRWSDGAIARELGCSDRTVRRWRQRLGLEAWGKGDQLRQAVAGGNLIQVATRPL